MNVRRSFITVGGVWALALALYARTLAPSITWAHFGADGGDLIGAAYFLGVPHPAGYPAYVTLGHLFAQLPIGSVAFRLNLMSAVCMASAAALITFGLLRSMRRPRALMAALGGLSFAAAPLVWGQATIAEVYALNALFAAAVVGLVLPMMLRGEPISARSLSAAFFLWGLGLGNHLTLIFLAPLLLAALTHFSRFTPHSSPGAFHSSLLTRSSLLITYHSSLFTLLGLSGYLLVPLRAAAQPPVNWLGEVTWRSVAAFIGGELYRPYAFGAPLNEYPQRVLTLARAAIDQFGPFGLLLIAIGLSQLGRVPRRVSIAMGAVTAFYVIFAIAYRPPDWIVYLIPVWLLAAWLLAGGAYRLVEWRPSILHRTFCESPEVAAQRAVPGAIAVAAQRVVPGAITVAAQRAVPGAIVESFSALRLTPPVWRMASGVAAILLLPGLMIAANFTAQDLSADREAEAFARKVWQAVPADAILVTHTDASTFTLWYYRLVEGQRPDTTIVDQRLAGYDWYAPMLRAQSARREQHPPRAPVLPLVDPLDVTWLADLRAANSDRVVCDLETDPLRLNCD